MNTTPMTIDATVTPDGTLVLPASVHLPPGPIRITVESLASSPLQQRGLLEVLQQIHEGQAQRGFKGRSKEEIDADVNALRDEWDERMNEIEQLQDECRRGRE